MSETWSSRPFVSYDGPDENKVRAEVHVIKGFGRVGGIEPSAKGESNKVSFKVDNTKYLVAGWAPTNSDVFKAIKKAEETGDPIHFRIEIRRKPGVDRTIPIQELRSSTDKAKENTFRGIAAVKTDDDADWIISEHAHTRIDEDPTTSTGNSAYNFDLDELRSLRPGANNSSNESNALSGQRNNEPAPYYTFDFDGNVLPGSTAVSVPLTIFKFLTEYVKKNSIDVPAEAVFKAVIPVLEVCNRAQIEVVGDKLSHPELGSPSHTRARAIVFDVIENGRVPFNEQTFVSSDAMDEWCENAFRKTVGMWRWSIKVVNRFESNSDSKE